MLLTRQPPHASACRGGRRTGGSRRRD